MVACVLAAYVLGLVVGGQITGTAGDLHRTIVSCGESYWEGAGRDGTPCN